METVTVWRIGDDSGERMSFQVEIVRYGELDVVTHSGTFGVFARDAYHLRIDIRGIYLVPATRV